ncbi:uncharacterized protein LDX57_007741 [Aspergillus melleus]|uniref:uncharacterized protein n=1 Tax=Aspergillus melleus TaxID=138277 RepID=UPI001E8D2B68|nr:uncharacterized protein LDX57_007741 [Aspergillus melleus]KAH8430070.1 hypothetical protein LDX57_007741 [Aspergillus melleus]
MAICKHPRDDCSATHKSRRKADTAHCICVGIYYAHSVLRMVTGMGDTGIHHDRAAYMYVHMWLMIFRKASCRLHGQVFRTSGSSSIRFGSHARMDDEYHKDWCM